MERIIDKAGSRRYGSDRLPGKGRILCTGVPVCQSYPPRWHQRVIRFSVSVLAWLFRLLVVVYFLVALGIIGLRYAVLPGIDHWKEPIARSVSSVLNTSVRFGRLQASWASRNPRFEISELEILDPNGRPVVVLPSVRAELDWRSLFSLQPRFVSLVVQNSHFDVRRDTQGRIWALGQAFDPRDTEPVQPGAQARFVHWLLEQQQLDLVDASVRWIDESRTGQPLELQRVSAQWRASRTDQRFSMSAQPPSALGERLDASFELSDVGLNEDGRFTLLGSRGSVFAHVPGMHPAAWAPWVDLPHELGVSTLELAAWVPLLDGLPQSLIARLALDQGRWALDGQSGINLGSAQLLAVAGWDWLIRSAPADTVPGTPPVLDTMPPSPELRAGPVQHAAAAGRERGPDGLSYWFGLSQIDFDLPEMFQAPFRIDQITGYGKASLDEQGTPDLVFHALDLENPDLKATLSGRWRAGGDGPEGVIDLHGHMPRALIDAIDNYLPLDVDHDARTWMAESLKEGTLEDVVVRVQGDLHHFPFQSEPGKGDFLVEGRVVGALIDYLPATAGVPGWPALQRLEGRARLHRADLSIRGDAAVMVLAETHTIHLEGIEARIPDIEQNSVLSVQGVTRGNAQAYLALAKGSPLGALLEGVLDEARADGQWQVPVELVIPLLNSDDSRVAGHILFEKGSTLQLMPELPELTALQGKLAFTESGLKAEALKGRALGGDITLSGGLGARQKGLILQGQAADKALQSYLGLQGGRRIQGNLPYRVRIDRDKAGSLVLEASSDLKSVALDLPAPFAKVQGKPLPVSLDWRRRDASSRLLSVTVADQAVVSLLHQTSRPADPYFSAGALGVGKTPALPAAGLVVDISSADLDLDAWRVVINEFSVPLAGETTVPSPAIFPPLAQVRVQSTHARLLGQALDHFTITAQRPQAQQWRVDVVSSQVAGTAFWRASDQGIPGRVDAKFDRLALGTETDAQDAAQNGSRQPPAQEGGAVTSSFAEELDIPGVSLYVKNFRLYGREVGELTVMGLNQERGRLWRLDELRLEHPAATLTGSGMWRLAGPERGLKLSASADVRDFGAYLDQIGHEGVMTDGKGNVSADIVWRNMPWAFDRADLNGELTFELSNGRFMTVNSYTARLLALLSLQSVSRLARLEFKPAQAAENGFPFDTLKGKVQLQKGILKTRDYRVTGPVATIVIEGTVNLVREALDLEAVVVPNLDVSGAAVAAGIAINPIVGVGAFLTQWLLQAPLSRAMSVQYHIDGRWSDPVIRETAAREVTDQKAAGPAH